MHKERNLRSKDVRIKRKLERGQRRQRLATRHRLERLWKQIRLHRLEPHRREESPPGRTRTCDGCRIGLEGVLGALSDLAEDRRGRGVGRRRRGVEKLVDDGADLAGDVRRTEGVELAHGEDEGPFVRDVESALGFF